MSTPGPDPTRLLHRVNELRKALANRPVEMLANNAGVDYRAADGGEGCFSLEYWRQEVLISYPGFVARSGIDGQELPPFIQAMLMYHLSTADGAPLAGRWISFSELPDGRFYNQAFQGYTGGELRRAILAREDFERSAARLGGVYQAAGDPSPGTLAFRFQALPRIPLLVAFWEGDDELPGSFQVLFDASASHYLPTDGCALLGSTLCRMLIKAL